MHIGFIEDTPLRGGTQIWVTEAVAYFLSRGEEVTVLAPTDTFMAKTCEKAGARVVTYDFDGVVSKSEDFEKRWIKGLAPCDVAVTTVHPPRGGFHCAVFAAQCLKKGNLGTILVPKTGSIVPWYQREFYLPDPNVKTHVICITKFTRKYLIENYEIPEEMISLIYQGTEVNRFISSIESKTEAMKRYPLPDGAGPILGSVGAMENRKGQIILLQAIKRLIDADKLPNVHVMFVGEGPDEAMLKAVAEVYGLQDHVSFFPFTSEPNYVFDRIDVLALPSLYKEGLPNVLLEAMSMKLPVIATNLAGIPEVIFDDQTGFLTEPGNVEQFSDAVEKLWRNEGVCSEIGENARKLMKEHFDKATQFDHFLKHFQALSDNV